MMNQETVQDGTNQACPLPVFPDQLDDEALVQRIQQRGLGWKLAFNTLLGRHQRWILGHCVLRLGNYHDAQDVAQRVLLRAFHSLARFEGRSAFRTWLYTISENQCRTWLVQRARYVNTEHIESLIELSQAEHVGTSDTVAERDAVATALGQVSPQALEVLRLRFFEDHSIGEIASTLAISLSAAKMRLYRALDQFKDYYLLAVEHHGDAGDLLTGQRH